MKRQRRNVLDDTPGSARPVPDQLWLDTDASDRLNNLPRTDDQRCEAIKRAREETMLNLEPLEAGMSIARATVLGRVDDVAWHSVPGTPAT